MRIGTGMGMGVGLGVALQGRHISTSRGTLIGLSSGGEHRVLTRGLRQHHRLSE